LAKRQRDKRDFLTGDLTVMLLSISAGGTGLHLAPGCRCCVFWGSRPFSPAQIHQTSKRIHRIGQDEAVQVDHLIAVGSVDHSIDKMHGDKKGLADALVDGDWQHFEGGNLDWRRSGRIVENCLPLDGNGNFVKRAPDKQRKRKRPASPGARAAQPACENAQN
jgi:SNF2 family DNA or RNA helicase